MASWVGPSPFNGQSINVGSPTEAEAVKAHFRENKKRRRVHYDDNGLAVNSGFMHKVGKGGRTYKPPMRTLTDSKGNTYQTPDVVKWDDWLDMFRAQGSEITEQYEKDPAWKRCQSLADMVDYVFNVTKSKDNIFSVDCPDGSHIEHMDYAQNFCGILRVYFRGGNVVCYFYVPRGVWGTLSNLAGSTATRPGVDGKDRHLVGIYFWNLIRIRGTVHGNRYECCYVEGGAGYEPRPAKSETEYSQKQMNAIRKMRKEEAALRADGQGAAADQLAEEIERTENALQLVTKKSQMSAYEMGHRDRLRAYFKEDEKHPLSALLGRLDVDNDKDRMAVLSSIPSAMTNANIMAVKIRRAGNNLHGAARKEFDDAGKSVDGDADKFNPLLRQEEVLVKYNLWPWY